MNERLISRSRQFYRVGIFALTALLILTPPGWAVVGQAERFDQFKEEELDQFHKNLVSEETGASSFERLQALGQELEEKEAQLNAIEKGKTSGGKLPATAQQDPEAFKKEVENLRRQLLAIPKRDRVRIEVQGDYRYDSNINRSPLRQENSDSVMDVSPLVHFDLSGRKTDLRFEVLGGKQWNIHYPEKDFYTAEERIRYRRRYFKKTAHSAQSRIARTSNKTPELNIEKVRWDSQQNMAANYAFSRKLSLNTEYDLTHRYFNQEPFDQDSNWTVLAAPSAFWNFTPKTRISLGWRLGQNRIRTKVGNTVTQEVHGGYFGRITRKSSVSFDLSYSHQTPKSLETAEVNTVTTGFGYIYQITGKTQVLAQIIRSVQDTSSNVISIVDGVEQTEKSDQHFTNTGLTLSLNSRLTRKLTAVMTGSVSQFKNEISASADADADTKTQQITLPFTFSVTYLLRSWIRLNLGYGFTYRTGDEDLDKFRSHVWQTSMHLTF